MDVSSELDHFFYHSDHLGSTNYITDVNGQIRQHVEYIPFGETLLESHTTSNRQPYLFNSKELDRGTGLYYYGARYYDPFSSMWLSEDPLSDKYHGWSPYNYTLNNPIKYIDPDGRQTAKNDESDIAVVENIGLISEIADNDIGNKIRQANQNGKFYSYHKGGKKWKQGFMGNKSVSSKKVEFSKAVNKNLPVAFRLVSDASSLISAASLINDFVSGEKNSGEFVFEGGLMLLPTPAGILFSSPGLGQGSDLEDFYLFLNLSPEHKEMIKGVPNYMKNRHNSMLQNIELAPVMKPRN